MQLLIFAVRAQHPLGEIGDGEAARPRRIVAQPQPADLHRIAGAIFGDGNEDGQLLPDGVAVVLEDRVALAVARAVGVLFADGQSGGRPHAPGFVVAQIDRFRLRIADRIVMPRRQPVRLAVAEPGEAQAAFADHGAEVRVRHHVDPGRGRCGCRASR